MRVGLFLYRLATRALSPVVGLTMRSRMKKGKEAPETLHARFAKDLPVRSEGPLVWLHGASVGESKLCLLVADALQAERSDLIFLHTCQTLTGAALIKSDIAQKPNRIYLPAPIDTPSIAKRFAEHWKPNLALFSESEIWPNLLLEIRKRDTKTALINARMTAKSMQGWARWPDTAKTIFGDFDLIAASDEKTAEALQKHASHTFALPANLKVDLPPPSVNQDELDVLKAAIGDRPVFLAASTHPGEEALALDALAEMEPRPFLIIVPRHPERGDEVETLCHTRHYTVSRRSQAQAISDETAVLLADTMGEMGLWISLADTVYLGGGHTKGIGGHNPLEAIRLGKPVLTGPHVFNFTAMMHELECQGGLSFVETPSDLANAFPAPKPPQLESDAGSPLHVLMDQLMPLLAPQGGGHA